MIYYYDERGLCYKVENENGEIENLYGYVEVTVNDDGTITKGEEFDGELQNFKESTLSAEQALEAVKNFCYSTDPDLKQIEEGGKYPVYWQMDDEIKNQQ
ncbi:MAG: hypothetical protein K6B68_18265 [Eubacterium sp.]|nr:hypothetical protein [Eubacterium sp.]